MSGNDSDGGGIMGGVEDFKGSDRKAARMARFNNRLAGNRYKEVRCSPNNDFGSSIRNSQLTVSLKRPALPRGRHGSPQGAIGQRCEVPVRVCVPSTKENFVTIRPKCTL